MAPVEALQTRWVLHADPLSAYGCDVRAVSYRSAALMADKHQLWRMVRNNQAAFQANAPEG
jgi:hypothetical protein